jgi:glycogen debranching enzyme
MPRKPSNAGRSNWLVRINARPDTIYVSHGRTVLATGRDGFVHGGAGFGLFVHETRLLSRYRYLIDGEPPQPNVLSSVEQHSWLGYYVTQVPGASRLPRDQGSGQVPNVALETLELRVSRFAGDGVHEDCDLTNFSSDSSSFQFAIEMDADFADLTEDEDERVQRGSIRRRWSAAHQRLDFDYTASHRYRNQNESGTARIDRGLSISFSGSESRGRYRNGRAVFDVKLAPGASWHLCIDLAPRIDGKQTQPLHACRDFFSRAGTGRRVARSTGPSVVQPVTRALTTVANGALEQARLDLSSLRLFDLDAGQHGWTIAAGLPMYVALYGRDVLTAGWQASMLGPEMMLGALDVLRRTQGRERNDWRDEERGRMIHEMHTGPLSALNFNPRGRSYSSTTTSALYPFIVAELWHWTGDKTLIAPFIKPAIEALRWLDRSADLDGDGLYEYKTRSADGVRNQGWKDSSDAIVDEDGRLVDPPIATCEEQGFAYISKLHFSEVLWWLGRRDDALTLYRQAEQLKERFNDAFWDDQLGFFALGLDARKRRIRTITSNAGHCVATAICDTDRVEPLVDRMFEPDLFSGWGIRTLSSDHPRFNPYSYHRGSVWPVEHGTFALGFMRYGLHDRAEQIARAQFEAAGLFDFHRLPELFSGHPRDDEHPFPAIYPNSNTPQAWSASSVYSLLQALLGLYPYAPLKLLVVDPHLPEWLPEITLRDLRVGRARITIRFRRERSGRSSYRILEQRGKLHVVRQPMPWSLTATWAERLRDVMASMVPGH